MIRAALFAGALALLASQAHAGGGANALGGQNSSAGVVTVPPPITTGTQWYPAFSNSLATTTAAPAQNTARCTPFNWPFSAHVDKAVISVLTAGTGPLNIALYTSALDSVTGKHQPQTLITDPSLAVAVTSVAFVTINLGVAGVGVPLQKGVNWVCVNDAVASDAVRYFGLGTSSIQLSALVGSAGAAFVAGGNQPLSITIAINAGTTTANWPSFVGQTFNDTLSNAPSAPNLALEIATVP